jgi:transcription initiation factor TFIIB
MIEGLFMSLNKIEIQKNKENSVTCPDCNNFIIQNGHERVCGDCGLIIDDRFYVDSYQFNEVNNNEKSVGDQYVSVGKVVDNVCTLGSHLDYYYSKTFHDFKHQIVSSNQQRLFKRLKKYYSLPLKIKNRETDYRILKILSKVVQYLKLSSPVKNRAAFIYQKIKRNAKFIRNHVSLIGFCIFYASREFTHNAPISIRELCQVFRTMNHRISPRLIIRDSIEYQCFIKEKSKPHRSEDYIERLVNSIVSSEYITSRMNKKGSRWSLKDYKLKMLKKCDQILKSMSFRIRGSRNPFILAGAIVYCSDKLIAKEYNTKSILTQKIASESMKIAEYSIRDHFVKILKPLFFSK